MGLEEDFISAVNKFKEIRLPFVQNQTKKHQFEMLCRFDEFTVDLFGLYQQAIVGDINVPKKDYLDPDEKSWMWAWIKGNNKWHGWNKCKGMKKNESMHKFTEKLAELVEKLPNVIEEWKDEMDPRVPDLNAWIPEEEKEQRLLFIEECKRERRGYRNATKDTFGTILE